MNAVVERSEQIKWRDALDVLGRCFHDDAALNKGLEMARDCCHPDAQWLVSLFPAGVDVTRERAQELMREQSDDMRAVFLTYHFSGWALGDWALVRRAAQMGYAPAQASLGDFSLYDGEEEDADEAFMWVQRAAAQGDRNGTYGLARCFSHGVGCSKDGAKGIDLYRQAAELEHKDAQLEYGTHAFGKLDWERYHWWVRAAERGGDSGMLRRAVTDLLPSFERGELGRVLHTVAPAIGSSLDVANDRVFCSSLGMGEVEELQRVVELHKAMLARARRAIDCWSMSGRRLKVVKDIRVMIAKKAWEEAWRWGQKEHVEQAKKSKPS